VLDAWLEVELVSDVVLAVVEVVDVVVRDGVDVLELEELLLVVVATEEDFIVLELEEVDAVVDVEGDRVDVEEDDVEEDEVDVERVMLEVRIDVPVEVSTAQYALAVPLWMTKFVPSVSGASAAVLIESTVGVVHELPRLVDTEYHTV